jgi:hypothetical protein
MRPLTSIYPLPRFRITTTLALAVLLMAAGACDEPSGRAQPQVLSVGLDHDRALAVLELEAPLAADEPLTAAGFQRILNAAQSYYVGQRGFERPQVAAVATELVRVLNAAGLVQGRGAHASVELGDSPESLLRVIDVQAKEGQISPRLANALRGAWAAGTKLQDEDALLAYIDAEFGRVAWTPKEQPIVDAFVEIARYSAAYWTDDGNGNGNGGNGGGQPQQRRIPTWVTILADALGGAVGGAAGAAAGGPVGAGIGAGLMGAAASYVFSNK